LTVPKIQNFWDKPGLGCICQHIRRPFFNSDQYTFDKCRDQFIAVANVVPDDIAALPCLLSDTLKRTFLKPKLEETPLKRVKNIRSPLINQFFTSH